MEIPFKVGDIVRVGKYKNRLAKIIRFSRNERGQITVLIDPVPKGRKKTKEMGLFKIWTTADALVAAGMGAFWLDARSGHTIELSRGGGDFQYHMHYVVENPDEFGLTIREDDWWAGEFAPNELADYPPDMVKKLMSRWVKVYEQMRTVNFTSADRLTPQLLKAMQGFLIDQRIAKKDVVLMAEPSHTVVAEMPGEEFVVATLRDFRGRGKRMTAVLATNEKLCEKLAIQRHRKVTASVTAAVVAAMKPDIKTIRRVAKMTKQQFLKEMPDGFSYDDSAWYAGRRMSLDEIRLGPSFFEIKGRALFDAIRTKAKGQRLPVKASVTAATDELYHTTSLHGMAKILQSRTFRSGAHGGFISFAERPYFGDISGNDAVIVLDRAALRSRVMPVEYTEQWYDRYPEQAGYIAGEGWREQYQEPEDCYDEDGWADDECVERAYREAELQSFLYKKDEREWLSRSSGDLRLPAEAFKRIVVPKAKLATVEALLKKLRLKLPVKVLKGKATASHSPSKCMHSGCDKPPEVDVIWADGRGRAWFCNNCFPKWKKEEGGRDIVRERQLEDGKAPKKYGESTKEGND